MESISISIDPKEFDKIVHAPNALPEGGDLKMTIKEHATASGLPGVCLSFTVRMPDGKLATAQTVTTWRALQSAVQSADAMLKKRESNQ